MTVLVDDQVLAGLLRRGGSIPEGRVFTCGHWYLRLCQAVAGDAGGRLSGPLKLLPPTRRQAATEAIFALPQWIELLSWREVVPVMARQMHGSGQGLNLLAREVLATATILNAKVVIAEGNEHPRLRSALASVGLA